MKTQKIMTTLFLVLAIFAVSGCTSNDIEANERSAISKVRTIVTAQITYSATDGEGSYAKDLRTLIYAGLLDSGSDYGYRFSTSSEGIRTFTVNADPVVPGRTGIRHFFADESGDIRWSTDGGANVYSPPL